MKTTRLFRIVIATAIALPALGAAYLYLDWVGYYSPASVHNWKAVVAVGMAINDDVATHQADLRQWVVDHETAELNRSHQELGLRYVITDHPAAGDHRLLATVVVHRTGPTTTVTAITNQKDHMVYTFAPPPDELVSSHQEKGMPTVAPAAGDDVFYLYLDRSWTDYTRAHLLGRPGK